MSDRSDLFIVVVSFTVTLSGWIVYKYLLQKNNNQEKNVVIIKNDTFIRTPNTLSYDFDVKVDELPAFFDIKTNKNSNTDADIHVGINNNIISMSQYDGGQWITAGVQQLSENMNIQKDYLLNVNMDCGEITVSCNGKQLFNSPPCVTKSSKIVGPLPWLKLENLTFKS